MNHAPLKKFAQNTRTKLRSQIASRLDYVLHNDDAYLRAHQKEKNLIASLMDSKGKDQLLEETAYIWFNRLTALRFMDNRGYNPIRIVSPAEGESQPQLLSELYQGRTPVEITAASVEIQDYLQGRISSADPDREAYKTALLAWCNAMATPMPFLFKRIDDWAALLLPQDLLSLESVITDIQKAIQPEDCQDVEIIGWLYQYYISEKKDEVFAGLKKNKKITRENIPAATQLFTPEWIVRYMVENSLGRLWLNNNPTSSLKDRMRYFVETDPEQEILKISGPEEIKLIDPCCGSGHILVYAFDLLYAIYEEEGYSIQEIPELIFRNNLYGVDIDDRAASLAAFSLSMKAIEKDKRLIHKSVFPHVIAVQDVDVETTGLNVSRELKASLEYLKDAKNLGSLIPVAKEMVPEIRELSATYVGQDQDDWIAQNEQNNLETALLLLEYLSPIYHCVVTNPPYKKKSDLNRQLQVSMERLYPNSKGDLGTVFIERGQSLALMGGYLGMINQQSWMFLSGYETLRLEIVNNSTIMCLAHLGARAFDSIGGEVVQTAVFVNKNGKEDSTGIYHRLVSGKTEKEKENLFLAGEKQYRKRTSDFSQIPGSLIAYWVSDRMVQLFRNQPLSFYFMTREGMATADNERFLRLWPEVSFNKTSLSGAGSKWYPYNKGGGHRKWYGNDWYLVNWENDGWEIKNNKDPKTGRIRSHNYNGEFALRKGLSWSALSTDSFSIRYSIEGFLFDSKGAKGFTDENHLYILFLLGSKVASEFLKILSPTLDFKVGDIIQIPYIIPDSDFQIKPIVTLAKSEWDLRETSWNFRRSPLLTNFKDPERRVMIDECIEDVIWPPLDGASVAISDSYNSFTSFWRKQFLNMVKYENEINQYFIDRYELSNEISPKIKYEEITFLQNELVPEALKKGVIEFNKDEIFRQFLSYAIGCIFGRYSIDNDGLVIANAGDGVDEFLCKVPTPTFIPDKSGILPITTEDDFSDDLPSQVEAFLKACFGENSIIDNIRYIEEAIGRDLRTFFDKDFYKDHLQRYKKRPIYWMISSPSGCLRALIYLHRYTRDTISIFLNDYLRPYQKKLAAKASVQEQILVSGTSTGAEKTRSQKELDRVRNAQIELEAWERDVVYPMATQRIELDLDDGVKVNYGKLGAILEKVKGLNS